MDDNNKVTLGIRAARLAAGLTQAEACRLLGIPPRTLESWEQGKREPAPWVARLVVEEIIRINNTNQNSKKVEDEIMLAINTNKSVVRMTKAQYDEAVKIRDGGDSAILVLDGDNVERVQYDTDGAERWTQFGFQDSVLSDGDPYMLLFDDCQISQET